MGNLYLIPSLLGEEARDFFPEETKQLIFSLDFFYVENEKSARRFLRKIGYK